MNFYVGITDENWFNFLAQQNLGEVNFWRPKDQKVFHAEPGSPFLFKLKKPKHAIVGVGFFAAYRRLPVQKVWDAFWTRKRHF